MESLFYRYRNIAVLLLALFSQLMLLAWQIRGDNDVPLVRVWAITAVTPVASVIENARHASTGFFSSHFQISDARSQVTRLQSEANQLRLENQMLRNQLAEAQRAEQLAGFQSKVLSKMIGARVIGSTSGQGSRTILIDRGRASGVQRGMAVVTPDGIVGKVFAVYPIASQVMAITDQGFAAGVESQKNHTHGVLKGLGNGDAKVDYVPGGSQVEVGEMFYTSGEDRVFPKGMAVGKVTSVKDSAGFMEILVQPTGVSNAPEEVLVILDPVHQAIPDVPQTETGVFLAPEPAQDGDHPQTPQTGTQADQLMDQYKKIGAAQNHTFGEGAPGSLPPNFNLKVPDANTAAQPQPPVPPAPKKQFD